MQNKVFGKAVLLTFWFIFSLFFTLGLFVIVSSLREIIFGFKPWLNDIDTAKWMKNYFKSNKWPLVVSAIITAILLYIYYNAFFLKFGFVINLTLFLPAFVLENLIFIVKVFLKRLVGSLIPEIYGILIPIAEFYYVYSIVEFVYRKAIIENKTTNAMLTLVKE